MDHSVKYPSESEAINLHLPNEEITKVLIILFHLTYLWEDSVVFQPTAFFKWLITLTFKKPSGSYQGF